jgi:2-polyprenyl-6-hydroxyphenyl methylase/3-demethylubiquinone-9 3-methyltransferase
MEQPAIDTYHGYEQPDPPHQDHYLELLLHYLRTAGVKRILDAGCGDGNFTASLVERGFEVCGIDSSVNGIAQAKTRHPQIHFARGSVYNDMCAAFGGCPPFDALVSIEVIEHLFSPRDFLRQCHAAVRPNGLLIITTPYWGYFKNIVLALTNRIDKALTARWEGGHIKHFSYSTLRWSLEQNDFEYVAFHGTGRRVPYLWMGMLMVGRRR